MPRHSAYTPIAVGFWLLSLPLWLSVFLSDSAAGSWTNGIAASVMVLLGLLVRLGGDRRG